MPNRWMGCSWSGHKRAVRSGVWPATRGLLCPPAPTSSLGRAQAVSEHEEDQAPVAGFVAVALGGRHELFDLKTGQVFSFVVHFVQCTPIFPTEKPLTFKAATF